METASLGDELIKEVWACWALIEVVIRELAAHFSIMTLWSVVRLIRWSNISDPLAIWVSNPSLTLVAFYRWLWRHRILEWIQWTLICTWLFYRCVLVHRLAEFRVDLTWFTFLFRHVPLLLLYLLSIFLEMSEIKPWLSHGVQTFRILYEVHVHILDLSLVDYLVVGLHILWRRHLTIHGVVLVSLVQSGVLRWRNKLLVLWMWSLFC